MALPTKERWPLGAYTSRDSPPMGVPWIRRRWSPCNGLYVSVRARRKRRASLPAARALEAQLVVQTEPAARLRQEVFHDREVIAVHAIECVIAAHADIVHPRFLRDANAGGEIYDPVSL